MTSQTNEIHELETFQYADVGPGAGGRAERAHHDRTGAVAETTIVSQELLAAAAELATTLAAGLAWGLLPLYFAAERPVLRNAA